MPMAAAVLPTVLQPQATYLPPCHAGSNSKYSRPGVSRTQPRRVLSPQKKTSTESRSSANGVRPKYEDIPEEELMKYIGKTLPDGRRVVENAFGVPMVINPGDIFFD